MLSPGRLARATRSVTSKYRCPPVVSGYSPLHNALRAALLVSGGFLLPQFHHKRLKSVSTLLYYLPLARVLGSSCSTLFCRYQTSPCLLQGIACSLPNVTSIFTCPWVDVARPNAMGSLAFSFMCTTNQGRERYVCLRFLTTIDFFSGF